MTNYLRERVARAICEAREELEAPEVLDSAYYRMADAAIAEMGGVRVGDTPQGAAVRFAVPKGKTLDEMRAWLRESDEGKTLYNTGDCLLVWANEGDLFNSQFLAAIKPAPDNAQEAARVLVRKMAQTWPKATHAAAKEFPHVGFITAAGVVGAALRAIAEGQEDD